MGPPSVMTLEDVDKATLNDIAEACHVSAEDIEDVYECTPLQLGIMVDSAKHGGKVYVNHFTFSLSPEMDLERFREAFNQVVQREPVLRTRIVDCHLGILQVVIREDHYPPCLSLDTVEYLLTEPPMSLGTPLMHSALLDRRWVLTLHHAIIDQQAIVAMGTDVMHIYNGQAPDVHTSFKAFVQHCNSIDATDATNFWKSRFKAFPSIFPSVPRGHTASTTHRLNKNISLKGLGRTVSISLLPSYIEAAWAITASVYTGSENVAFGFVLSGRMPGLENENTLGPTIATIPVAITLQRNVTLERHLKDVTRARREAQAHPALHFGMKNIRNVSDEAEAASKFSTLLNIRSTAGTSTGRSDIIYEGGDEVYGPYGLSLTCIIVDDGLFLDVSFDSAVLCELQMQRILRQFEHTIHLLLRVPPHTKLGALELLNPDDRIELFRWNETFPQIVERCLHEPFSDHARTWPADIAVDSHDGQLTYQELEEMTDRLAYEIQQRWNPDGNAIPFIFEKSVWAVVAAISILKAGGSCVPIDAAHPYDRKLAIISSTNANTILVSTAQYEQSVFPGANVLTVSAATIGELLMDMTMELKKISPTQTAYILFTSGSTGTPKGVVHDHMSIVSSFSSVGPRIGLERGLRVLQFSAHVWDVSIMEIFGTLMFGGCVCIPSEEARLSNLAGFIRSNRIDSTLLTPTVLRTLRPEDVPNLKILLSAGEPIDKETARTWGMSLRLINAWGPVESGYSAIAELHSSSPYPETIGSGVGCGAWIVDRNDPNKLAPIGAVGELIVEGPNVALGYLNDRISTAASFIRQPRWLIDCRGKSYNSRVYRTGDLAKHNPDGSIGFLGRQDNQVKVRGQRVEIGEVEAVIASSADVREVVATTQISAAEQIYLVAILCLEDPELPSGHNLRELSSDHIKVKEHVNNIENLVRAKLPSYMVPSAWVVVETLPRTSSTKLDRVSVYTWLKARTISTVAEDCQEHRNGISLTPPASAEEELLCSVWASTLSIPKEQIGRESSFLQLGGDSISAMQIASRCRRSGLELSVAALLRSVDLSAAAAQCKELVIPPLSTQPLSEDTFARKPPMSRSASRSLCLQEQDIESVASTTDAQAWMLATGELGDVAFRTEWVLRSSKGLDAARLQKACEEIVRHHPVLRTVFVQFEGAMFQVVLRDAHNLKVSGDGNVTVLKSGPEVRHLPQFYLLRSGPACHGLRLEIHHALYDAISMAIILRDLDAAYTGQPLSVGPHFHDWISHVSKADVFVAQGFWKRLLQDSTMTHLVPLYQPIRGSVIDSRAQIRVPLSSMQMQCGTPASVLKAAWAQVISVALGQNDVVFGEVSANRNLPFADVAAVCGPCLNILPVRAQLDQDTTHGSLISHLQHQSNCASAHNHLGFRSIIRECTVWPSWTRFGSIVVYQNHGFAAEGTFQIGGIECSLSAHGRSGDSSDIWVIANPEYDELVAELLYSSSTLSSQQMRWITRSLTTILEMMPTSLDNCISKSNSLLPSIGTLWNSQASRPPNVWSYLTVVPTPQAQQIVSQAWSEVGLDASIIGDQECSMFDCGADVVTAMLLSEYYQSCGHDITTKDVVNNPRRDLQCLLVDAAMRPVPNGTSQSDKISQSQVEGKSARQHEARRAQNDPAASPHWDARCVSIHKMSQAVPSRSTGTGTATWNAGTLTRFPKRACSCTGSSYAEPSHNAASFLGCWRRGVVSTTSRSALSMSSSPTMDEHEPIAIVGYAYRAPGVGRRGMWDFLSKAKSAWSRVPDDRFDQDAYYHPDPEKAGCFSSQGAHFLPDDPYDFDAAFFGLRPDEARATDPQHRLLLECAFEAVESAGITLQELAGANVGVFAAHQQSDFLVHTMEDLPAASKYAAVGSAATMFANRLSYFFDLEGPSISIDGACASSSYAIHLACQSLRSGECEAALVGAAALIISPNTWITLDTMGALSPKGKCFSYDVKASGFGRGEGAGCLMIKRLSDAVRCGDAIRAVIRNSGCSHSGRTQGITMPSRAAQEKLLYRVHRGVGLNPSETPFVEGHGTGTQVGDPADAGAIASVVGSNRSASDPVYIGSLKSNFGHLEGASGVLSVIKAVMMIERGEILPNAMFEELNPNIEGHSRLQVARTLTPWPTNYPKRVCVTNFGFGGSNAAILLEGLSARSHEVNGHGLQNGYASQNGHVLHNGDTGATIEQPLQKLFVFSAKSESSLRTYLDSFADYLDEAPMSDVFLDDLCFTLGQRRSHFSHRVAAVADSWETLRQHLLEVSAIVKFSRTSDPVLAFSFTGQGAQYPQMACELLKYDSFASTIDTAESIFNSFGATWSLKDELNKSPSNSRINDVEISQPACTAIQLALIAVMREWNMMPAMVTGHSSGEIAAAYAAGYISFRAALAIAYFRGLAARQVQLDQSIAGAMLAIGINFEDAKTLVEQCESGYATVAAINSPESVTVSGDEEAITDILNLCETRGLFVRRLKVGVAYHSSHMEKVAASYVASIKPFLRTHTLENGELPPLAVFISSVTGNVEEQDTLDASYWARNLISPVRYLDAIQTMFTIQTNPTSGIRSNLSPPHVVVEIGPHSALKNATKQTIGEVLEQTGQKQSQIEYIPSLSRGRRADEALLQLAGNLFTLGVNIDLAKINQTSQANAHVLHDLPSYEWSKSTYRHGSRIMAKKLHPGRPFSTLLGRKSPYSEGNEHAFRLVFSVDEISWIKDHNIAGDVLFPFTGFYSLAIGALREVYPVLLDSVVIREFHVNRSLKIENDQRTDITTKLKPAETGTDGSSSTLWSFEILSWSDVQGWTLHCHGQIEAGNGDMTLESPTLLDAVEILSRPTLEERDAYNEYEVSRENGARFGPTFRTMDRLWWAPGVAVHETALRPLEIVQPLEKGSPVTVDAPTLDSFFHTIGAIQNLKDARPVWVPTYFPRLRISNHIPAEAGQRFTIVSRILEREEKAGVMRMSLAVFTTVQAARTLVLEIDALTLRCIAQPSQEDRNSQLPESYYETTVPYLDLIERDYVAKILSIPGLDDQSLQHRRDLNDACLCFLQRAVKDTAADDLSGMPPHLVNFWTWAKRLVAIERPSPRSVQQERALIESISNYNDACRMTCNVGEKLAPILRGQLEPLQVMMEDGLLSRYYETDTACARGNQAVASFMRSFSAINADMDIIEIGSGTGGTTLGILEAMTPDPGEKPSFNSYTYTDISPAFFENARAKLAPWLPQMKFERLDIEKDPSVQGFVAESYDLVVASNVLHATTDMTTTLEHVHRLLKPNGKLILLECVSHQPNTLPFALLPGWWLSSDDYRSSEGPFLTEDSWDNLLRSTGFSGIDGSIQDFPDAPEQLMTAIWSTKTTESDAVYTDKPITICGHPTNDEEQLFAQTIAEEISDQLGCETLYSPLPKLDTTKHPFCVFIDNAQHSIFKDMSSGMFDLLRNFWLDTAGILWVVPEGASPDSAMIKGFLRTLRQENTSKVFLLLENAPMSVQGADAVAKVAARLQSASEDTRAEQDLLCEDGIIHVPRLRSMTVAKETFGAEDGLLAKAEQCLGQGEDALEMTVDAVGTLDSIYFRRTTLLTEPIGDDEVLIKVEAAGVNFRDLLLVLGSIPWGSPGFEGAGVVVQAGRNVTDVQAGDRVFYVSKGGGFATHVRLADHRVCKMPEGISATDIASMPLAYLTASVSVIRVGQVREGETILIHAASGAVGQACIIMARHLGAQIFATAGSTEKRDFLHQTMGVPRNHIFSSRTTDFRDGIMCATNGKGIDVIINSLSGNLLQHTWSLIADSGRFVEIGRKDFLQNSHLAMRPFDRNVTFTGLDLNRYFNERPQDMKACLIELVDLFQRQVIRPIQPITELPVSEIATGLRRLQSGQNIGKVVITMGKDDRVLAERPSRLRRLQHGKLFNANATYLITGGTGGIGRSLAPWMLENGAGNVILLGRSGSSHPEVQKLLRQFQNTKVCLRAVACDVGSRDDVVNALEAIRDLPPIRGVIHSALYLRDAMFVNNTFDDWQKIMAPKVNAAWLLHDLLPKLDFFISLSSVDGVCGHVGQSIYSGTSTFLDAFTAHRLSLGLSATSISLPVIEDVGYVADRGLGSSLRTSLGVWLNASQIQTLIKGALIGDSSGLVKNGRSMSFMAAPGTAETPELPWERFNFLAALRHAFQRTSDKKLSTQVGSGPGARSRSYTSLEGILDALSDKVSSITMIDRDEVLPERKLDDYGLDSLVSVELRNWIRRELDAELPLTQIVGADNLKVLVEHIMSQMQASLQKVE